MPAFRDVLPYFSLIPSVASYTSTYFSAGTFHWRTAENFTAMESGMIACTAAAAVASETPLLTIALYFCIAVTLSAPFSGVSAPIVRASVSASLVLTPAPVIFSYVSAFACTPE